MQESKGFTLIELLIVIAIIGILASIVFININNSRKQARDAALKADLDSMRLSAEEIYETDGTYENVCTDSRTASSYSAAQLNGYNGKGACGPLKYKWAACVYENVNINKAWCVDNTGISKEIVTSDCDSINGSQSPSCP